MLLIPLLNRIRNELSQWIVVSRQRRELGRLSDHLLKDIGLSRVDAEREAVRPFWDREPLRDDTLRVRGRGLAQLQRGANCRQDGCCSPG